MSNETVATPTLGNSSPRLMGRVKWFNNKAGYGFITVSDGDRAGSDIFVHHSGVQVSNEQYKYLVQGEYVEFKVDKTEGGAHEYQAGDVSGINGGKLMCETRRDFRQTRSNYKTSDEEAYAEEEVPRPAPRRIQQRPRISEDTSDAPRQQSQPRNSAPRARGSGPRDGAEWTLVNKSAQSRGPRKSTSDPRPKSKAPPTDV